MNDTWRAVSGFGVLILLWAISACSLPVRVSAEGGAGASARAAEPAVPEVGYSLPLSVVAGRLVVPVELGSAAASQSVSLLIDLSSPMTLSLRADILQSLKLTEADTSVNLSAAGGFEGTVPRARLTAYSGSADLARISALNSIALDERPIAGSLGGEFLRDFRVVVDVQNKELKLLPPRAARKQVAPGEILRPVAVKGTEIRVPLVYADGSTAEMLLGSTDYDTTIDAAVSRPADGAMRILARSGDRTIDLARYLALRPVRQTGGAPVRSGVDLLEHFRLELDWGRGLAVFTETHPPEDLAADRAYFAAQSSGNLEALSAFLRSYPQSRFREDAARGVLDGQLARNAEDAAIVAAATDWLDAVAEHSRSEHALALVRQLAQQHADRIPMVLAVGEVALAAARADPKSLDRYRIHEVLGTLRLGQGDLAGAWRNFLVAVFGLPEDARVNLNLARIYERQARYRRALSRYRLTASLLGREPDELSEAEGAEVKSGLERLSAKVAANER